MNYITNTEPTKQILYLQSGNRRAGIFSYVQQVIHMAKVCEDKNIPMYVDFSEEMLYAKEGSTNDNVWEYYFEQPFKDINLAEYEKITAVWYQDDRPLVFTFRFEADSEYLKKARELCKKYVKIRPEIISEGNQFIKDNTNGEYLAIHKRGCDHENNRVFTIDHHFLETDKYIDKFEKLLVCSDEEFTISAFKQRYGSKVFAYPSARASTAQEGSNGVHNLSNKNNFIYQNGRSCVIEAYLLSQASFLLKTMSNVSHFALMNNENLKFTWIDNGYGCKY